MSDPPSRAIATVVIGLFVPGLLGWTAVSNPAAGVDRSADWVSVNFPQTGRGSPRSTAGAGTRGSSCAQAGQTPPLGLLPANRLATTTLAQPDLFVYVPASVAAKASSTTLKLTEGSRQWYQGNLVLPRQEGVVRVKLPGNLTLAVGKTYRWTVTIVCQGTGGSSSQDEIKGRLQRVQLPASVQTQINQGDPLQKAQLLAQSSIWLDTLMILADTYPTYKADWEELLTSVGLEAIAGVPPQ